MRENSSSVECLMQKGLEEVVGLDSGIGPAVHEVVLALMPLAVGSLLRARRQLQNTSPAPRRASLTPKTVKEHPSEIATGRLPKARRAARCGDVRPRLSGTKECSGALAEAG